MDTLEIHTLDALDALDPVTENVTMVGKIKRWVKSVLSMDGTLGKRKERKRGLFCFFNIVAFMATIASLPANIEVFLLEPMFGVAYGVVALASLFGVLAVVSKSNMTPGVVALCAYGYGVSIFLSDLTYRVKGETMWAPLVLIVDLLLVMEAPTHYTVVFVAGVTVWLCAVASEEMFRVGLFDLPGLLPQHGVQGRWELHRKQGECTELPCARDSGMLVSSVAVFLIDFIATRGFARDILKEQESMERTINTVQTIAELLAGYDVEGVSELLASPKTVLPEAMHNTLHKMEENLRKYRPYLPAALFEDMEDDVRQRCSLVPPPKLENDIATIVFTDICSSTSIWEGAPEGMRAGLKIHNNVIREAMYPLGGYEVKTIGDAFMVAFATTTDGVNFGLQVQQGLFDATWPTSLLEVVPICAVRSQVWGGLTVRIGVNTGEVTVEVNTLTGRTDYFGHTVNVASRLESACKPGAVAVPSELANSACVMCNAIVSDAQAVDMKGVSESMLISNMWPLMLSGRRRHPLRATSVQSDAKTFDNTSMERSQERSLDRSIDRSIESANSNTRRLSNLPISTPIPAEVPATVGTVELAVENYGNGTALEDLSAALSTLTIALDQSGGVLVTLLGNSICAGWNLTRNTPSHMENAIRFAQRLSRSTLCGAGLVSGTVHYGDVGARQQRFVTVMGNAVRQCRTLCDEATRSGERCLLDPSVGVALPQAIELLLMPDSTRHGIYRVLEELGSCED